MGQCTNLILQCMDYRIQPHVFDWIQKRGYLGNIDIISLGGSCKNKDVALKNISTCCEKHGVRHVFLTQHDDCAAYGGHAAFPSLTAEREQLIADMMALKAILRSLFPDVEVTTFYIQQDGDSWKIVEVQSGE